MDLRCDGSLVGYPNVTFSVNQTTVNADFAHINQTGNPNSDTTTVYDVSIPIAITNSLPITDVFNHITIKDMKGFGYLFVKMSLDIAARKLTQVPGTGKFTGFNVSTTNDKVYGNNGQTCIGRSYGSTATLSGNIIFDYRDDGPKPQGSISINY